MDTNLQKALDSLRAHAAADLGLLRELVDVNSYSTNRAGCDAVAEQLTRALAPLPSLRAERSPGVAHGAHLLFETEAARSGGHVLCIGHHDTVFPPGTFEGYVREGELARGPGVLDMKGGLVVVMAALRALEEAGALPRIPVRFISVSDEEVGSPESGALVRQAARGGAAALGFESGRVNDSIITARKGTASLRVHVHGRAAHAGNGHAEGANAIWALAKLIDRAQALTDYERGLTLNTGLVHGGEAKNTVPADAEAALDLRFLHEADGEGLQQAVLALVADVEAAVPGTHVEVLRRSWRFPLERTEANAALAQAYGALQRLAGLGDGESPLQGGGSDAANAAAEGVASIDGLGPRGRGFHTKDEYIEVATLLQKAEVLVRYLHGAAR